MLSPCRLNFTDHCFHHSRAELNMLWRSKATLSYTPLWWFCLTALNSPVLHVLLKPLLLLSCPRYIRCLSLRLFSSLDCEECRLLGDVSQRGSAVRAREIVLTAAMILLQEDLLTKSRRPIHPLLARERLRRLRRRTPQRPKRQPLLQIIVVLQVLQLELVLSRRSM